MYVWNKTYNHCWIIKYDYDWNYISQIIRCWNGSDLFQISDAIYHQ